MVELALVSHARGEQQGRDRRGGRAGLQESPSQGEHHRAGIRSATADGAHGTRVIFSGGTTGNGATEAQLMADYAKSVLEFDGTVLLEDQSTTTWENITNVIPLLEDVDRIKIASQPAHALKARAYLRRQRPDLAEKLVRADDYRPGEWTLVKPLLALYGLWTLRGLTADERQSQQSHL